MAHLPELTQTQRQMIACSLEIDGRPELAAAAVVSGHVSEFIYTGHGAPVSAKARRVEDIADALRGSIRLLGLPGAIAALRA